MAERKDFFVFYNGNFAGKTTNISKRGAASAVAWRKGKRARWDIANFINEAEVYGVDEKIPEHLLRKLHQPVSIVDTGGDREEGKQLVLVGIL